MGQLTLTLPLTLQTELESRAQREGISVDMYIIYALTRQMMLSPTYTVRVMPDNAVREQQEAFNHLRDSLNPMDEPVGLTKVTIEQFLAEREVGQREEELTDDIVMRLKQKIAAQQPL
jgi:hypothetical protein